MKKCLFILAFVATISIAYGQLQVSLTSTNCSCYGLCDGSITATVTGGTPPYQYYWESDTNQVTQTTDIITNLCAGMYWITVTDNGGQQVTDWIYLSEPSLITANICVTNPTCPTCNDGIINTNTSGGTPPYTYLWSNGATNPDLYPPISQGTYSFTIMDANLCTSTSSVQLPETSNNCHAYFNYNGYGDSLVQNQHIYVYNYSIPNNNSCITSYTWDFGDGAPINSIEPDTDHVYLFDGIYNICLTIQTSTGCTSTYCDSSVDILPPYTLSGYVYIDENGNCIKDAGENGIPSQAVQVTNGTQTYWGWSDYNGHYAISSHTGNYTVSLPNHTGYTINCSNSQPHNVALTSGYEINQDFALNCNGGFDLCVTNISFQGTSFPGEQVTITPYIGLNNPLCNYNPTPGQIIIVLNPMLIYNGVGSGIPTPTVYNTSNGDSLVWNVSNIFSTNLGYNYTVYALINTAAQIGDSACITGMILPMDGDINEMNNTYKMCIFIGNSCDPNMKEVYPQGTGINGNIPPTSDYLTYTIRFQNTGTAPAHNIFIIDTLSNNLDLTTLEIVATSHNMSKLLLPGNILRFDFHNIMLPDSTSNEPQSHGTVTYKIKNMSNLSEGTQIKNTAYIFFDYNPAVATNTTLNTIVTPQSVVEEKLVLNEISLYPNPATDKLNIQTSFKEDENMMVKISDLLGKTIRYEVIPVNKGTQTSTLKLNDMASGMYIIYITSANLEFSKELIIQ